jgi:3-oxoacyl-[acyl-carrier protein] reductase
MQPRLESQVAVITGAGRGIGHAIALRLASEGARVASVSRTETNAQKTADEINASRADAAKAYTVDVSDHAAVQKICEKILADFGRADILVNNAGVTRDMLSMRMSPADWDLVLNTNLKGAFNFVQALQRAMIKERRGRIINISSVIGIIGNAADQLRCEQGGPDWFHQSARQRAGEPEHYRERNRAGIHRDRYDERAV